MTSPVPPTDPLSELASWRRVAERLESEKAAFASAAVAQQERAERAEAAREKAERALWAIAGGDPDCYDPEAFRRGTARAYLTSLEARPTEGGTR